MRHAVVLDHDGVLNVSTVHDGRPYALRRADEFRLFLDAASATRRLAHAGLVLMVMTNQPDVGNGLLSATRQ